MAADIAGPMFGAKAARDFRTYVTVQDYGRDEISRAAIEIALSMYEDVRERLQKEP